MDDFTLSEAALWYASRGIPVFPCRPRGKEPLIEGGFHAATTDQELIRRWWARWPQGNIGIPTGAPSGWLVLDVDPRNGGHATLESWIARYGRWPDTAEAITGGGGRHIVFRHVDGLRCGPLAPGVDLKTEGGYIIAAPSIHPSGRAYSWDGLDGAVALERLPEPPGWLLRLARERRKPGETAAAPGEAKIPRGRRNQELASIAGVLRARGADQAALQEVLATVNRRLCDPPLADDEVAGIAESISRYDPQSRPDDPAAQRIFETLDEGRYVLRLPGIASELEVDRLRRDGGELMCELTARCWLPGARGVDGVLSIADFNLSSARARLDRAKLIAARAQTKEVDWPGIIEELAQRVLMAEREGPPAVVLADLPEPADDESWIVAGLPLLKNHPTILFGDGGSCKSYLALWFSILLARQKVNVLIADWELDEAEHGRRLRLLGGLDCRNIAYLRCSQPIIAEIDRLRRATRDHAIQYVILDSIALACGGPPESAEIANAYFRALRRLGCGTLSIGHIAKADDGDKKPFGSAFWHNSARATWFAKRTDPVGDEQRLLVGLFNRKANLGPIHPPVGFEITFEPGATRIRRSEVAHQAEFAGQMTVAQRMYALLRRGPLTVAEIAEQLEVSDASIRSAIARKSGVFMRLPDGRVALLSKEESYGSVQ